MANTTNVFILLLIKSAKVLILSGNALLNIFAIIIANDNVNPNRGTYNNLSANDVAIRKKILDAIAIVIK